MTGLSLMKCYRFLFPLFTYASLMSGSFDTEDLSLVSDLFESGEAIFELAESFRQKEAFTEACYWYKTRLEKEPQETFQLWFSKWMLGRIFEKSGKHAEAILWYMEACNENPNRPEPFYDLCHFYRLQGANHLSYLFGSEARRILGRMEAKEPFYEGFHPTLLDLELSIIAFYTPYQEEGWIAANRLVLDPTFPFHWKNSVYNNLLFYTKTIEKVDEIRIYANLPKIASHLSDRYYPLNPSIIRSEEGYFLLLRSVNYLQEGARNFHTEDIEGKFRTKNFLLELGKDFSLHSQVEIVENLLRKKYLGSLVDGLEDCRLIKNTEGFWFSCTTSDTNAQFLPKVSLCKLSLDLDQQPLFVRKFTTFSGFQEDRCEKNWLPFVRDDEIFFIYSFSPLLILKPDTDTGKCSLVTEQTLPKNLSNLRGSASPIPFHQGFLALTHEVVYKDDSTRCYLHRFVYMNRAYIVEKISKPFIFSHFGVEFCCGMTLNHEEDTLVIPYGFEDREARICLVGVDTVHAMLEDLED